MREADHQALALPQLRPRRGRNLIDRLRQVGRPIDADSATRGAATRRPAAGGGVDDQTDGGGHCTSVLCRVALAGRAQAVRSRPHVGIRKYGARSTGH